MKKVWVSVLLVMTLMVGFTSLSGAATDLDKITFMAEKTDVLVETFITVAQVQADRTMATQSGTAQVTALNRTADRLYVLSYDAVTRVITKAEGLAVVERTWVEVEIGTLVVLVDPARVVRY